MVCWRPEHFFVTFSGKIHLNILWCYKKPLELDLVGYTYSVMGCIKFQSSQTNKCLPCPRTTCPYQGYMNLSHGTVITVYTICKYIVGYLVPHRYCHGWAKTGYYLWLLMPVFHETDQWIYMEIHGYLWFVCHIWMTLVGAAAATHQCATAIHKLVELINLTPPLNKNTPWWIWTRIYWNTIISSAFPWNITLILLFHHILCIHRMDYVTFFIWMLYRD